MFTKYETRRKNSIFHYFDIRDYIIKHDIRNKILTFYTLGTFTCLCVRTLKTHVIALAMQLNHIYEEIKLTIAENKNIFPGIEIEVKDIWKDIQVLSGAYMLRVVGVLSKRVIYYYISKYILLK